MTSSELSGGTGFTYKDAVVAHYLAAMIGGMTAEALGARILQRVAQQQYDFSEPLDHVIIDVVSMADESVMRLSLQVKHSLTTSDAATNTDFREQVLALIVDGRLPASWKGSSPPASVAALVREHADRYHPLPVVLARKLLQVLDARVNLVDRRSAALQKSESFRGVRLKAPVSSMLHDTSRALRRKI